MTVCVAGGVVAPELQLSRHTCSQFQGNHALLKSLVGAPRGGRIIPPSSFLMCVLIPCSCVLLSCVLLSCVLLPDVLPVGVTSTCPALPAASSRHLPSLLFVPFRPAPPGPAQPAVLPGTDLTWSSRRPAGICLPGQPPFRRYLTLLLILPLPAGICLPCSPCRSAGICSPAQRAVPPTPDLRIPPLRRYLPGQPPFRRYLTLLLILPLPAGICLPCSPCRSAGICSPAQRAVPPTPDLRIPPLHRYLPGQRSLPFQPVPDSPAPAAGSTWFLPLLHILHILH